MFGVNSVRPTHIAKAFVSLLLAGFLISCGGGGGGGSGEKGSSKNKPTSNVKGTAIRILHGAIDANPVDLYSSLKEDKLGSSFFAESSFFVSLPSGCLLYTSDAADE